MTRKLDAKHLEAIESLREKYSEITAAIGNIAIEQEFLQEKIDSLTQEKAQQFAALKNVQNQENQLLDEMRERYGEGQINVADGTFTPAPGLPA